MFDKKTFSKNITDKLLENDITSPVLLDILDRFINKDNEDNFMIGFGHNQDNSEALFIEFSQLTCVLEDHGDDFIMSLAKLTDKEVVEVMKFNMTEKLQQGDWGKVNQVMAAYLKILYDIDSRHLFDGFACDEIHDYIMFIIQTA